jgi:hypothetical protein
MEETTYKFIGKWVLNIPGEVIDKLDDEFDVDWDTDDVEEAVMESDTSNPKSIGMQIWLTFMCKMQDTLAKRYPSFDRDKFDFDMSGGSDYYEVYYDGERISTVSDLDEAIAHQDEGDLE